MTRFVLSTVCISFPLLFSLLSQLSWVNEDDEVCSCQSVFLLFAFVAIVSHISRMYFQNETDALSITTKNLGCIQSFGEIFMTMYVGAIHISNRQELIACHPYHLILFSPNDLIQLKLFVCIKRTNIYISSCQFVSNISIFIWF